MRTFLLTGDVAALCLLSAIAIYATALNDSGHTSAEPYWAVLYFASLFFFSVVAWWKMCELRQMARFSATVAIAGVILVVLLDTTNVLVQYDRWVARGLPERGTLSWLKWR